MRSKFLQKVFYNWQAKIICFLLAVFAYFILIYSVQQSRTVTLPLDITYPDGYVAESNVPVSAELVIMGTEDQIYMIDASKISLSVDFSTVNREGVNYATVQIDTSGLSELIDSSSVSIYTKPSQVKVYFSETGAKQ